MNHTTLVSLKPAEKYRSYFNIKLESDLSDTLYNYSVYTFLISLVLQPVNLCNLFHLRNLG